MRPRGSFRCPGTFFNFVPEHGKSIFQNDADDKYSQPSRIVLKISFSDPF